MKMSNEILGTMLLIPALHASSQRLLLAIRGYFGRKFSAINKRVGVGGLNVRDIMWNYVGQTSVEAVTSLLA
jgi:hypothetical protein